MDGPKIPFHGFDVRGKYLEQVGYPEAIAVGHAFAKAMESKLVYIAGDGRPSTPKMLEGLRAGIQAAGATAIIIEGHMLERLTYAVGAGYGDGGIMVTGGSMPMHYTGFKFMGRDCSPLSADDMANFREEVQGYAPFDYTPYDAPPSPVSIGYHDFMAKALNEYGKWPADTQEFRIMVDAGISGADTELQRIAKRMGLPKNIKIMSVRDYDGKPDEGTSFKDVTRTRRLSTAMEAMQSHIGFAFNADGSAVLPYVPPGIPVTGGYLASYLTAITARRYPGDSVVYDHRLVFPMLACASASGAPVTLSLPGATFMKSMMRKGNAAFGADLSGRTYWREFWWSESGIMAAMLFAQLTYLTPKPMADLLRDSIRAFPTLDETLFSVHDAKDSIDYLSLIFSVGYGSQHQMETVAGHLVCRSTDDIVDWRMVARPIARTLIGVTLEGRGAADHLFLTKLRTALSGYLDDYNKAKTPKGQEPTAAATTPTTPSPHGTLQDGTQGSAEK